MKHKLNTKFGEATPSRRQPGNSNIHVLTIVSLIQYVSLMYLYACLQYLLAETYRLAVIIRFAIP